MTIPSMLKKHLFRTSQMKNITCKFEKKIPIVQSLVANLTTWQRHFWLHLKDREAHTKSAVVPTLFTLTRV